MLSDGIFSGPGNRNIAIAQNLVIVSESGDPERTELQGTPAEIGIQWLVPDADVPSAVSGVTFAGFDLALDVWDGTEPPAAFSLRRCRFLECATNCIHYHGGYLEAEDCLFRGNLGTGYGGAVWPGDGTTLTFTRCVFQDNHAQTAGGAVTTWSADLTFRFCLFINNSAGSSGGAIWNEDGGHLELINCTFYGNSAPEGSAAHSGYHTTLHFHNSVVAFGQGTPIACRYSYPHFYCSDIYGNEGGDWTGCGLSGQLGIEGNISLDPLFCDPANGDFALQPESPCAPFSPWSPECDLMGAVPVGCQSTGLWDSASAGPPVAPEIRVRPNPAGGTVSIFVPRLQTIPGQSLRLEILDASGRLVRALPDGLSSRNAGAGPAASPAAGTAGVGVVLDGRDERGQRLPSGVYFLRARAGDYLMSTRLVLVR